MQSDIIRPIVQRIFDRADAAPDKTAIVYEGGEITYGELRRDIKRAAMDISLAGVGSGDRVLIESAHDALYAILLYGTELTGAVAVPVENHVPTERAAEIANAVNARLAIVDRELSGIPALGREYIQSRIMSRNATDMEFEPLLGCDEAEILFTTGTTGKSKGVLLSHSALSSYVDIVNPTVGMNENTVFLINTPMNHAGGMRRLHMTLSAGGTAVLVDGVKNVKRFYDFANRYKITATYLPPSAVRMLLILSSKELAALDGQIEFVYTGSAPFPESDRRKLCALLPHARLYNAYGGSEIGSVSNYNYNVAEPLENCIGVPYNNVRVTITRDGREIMSSKDEPGLITVDSPMNMMCYVNAPELTASIMRGSAIVTSDTGYFDENGCLFFAGREDDVIIVGGLKVAPTEVEQAALFCGFVEDAACVPVTDRMMGSVAKLFVVVKDGFTLDRQALTEVLLTKLEAYKLPKLVSEIDEIPRTFNGKIDRKKLKESVK